jgi:exosome complex RNA-binding protein Rrp42 (RNase PH superfamily)
MSPELTQLASTVVERPGGRSPGALREVRFIPDFLRNAHGSVLVE